MADSPTIAVELSSRAFTAGSDLRGTLDLRNLDERARRAKVWLEWRTTDEHAISGKSDVVLVELEGRAIGGRARPSFAMRVPQEPLSYPGKQFSIEWWCVAELDLAWAIDPRAELSITVGPSAHPRPAPKRIVPLADTSWPSFSSVLGSVAAGGAGVVAAHVVAGSAPLLFGLAGGGVYLGLQQWARGQARRRFGTPSLVLDPGTPRLGEPLVLRVVTTPPIGLSGVDVRYRLTAIEELVVGSGRAKRTNVEQLHEQEGLLDRVTSVAGNRELILEQQLVLADGPWQSFEADRHKIAWSLELKLAIAGPKPFFRTYSCPLTILR